MTDESSLISEANITDHHIAMVRDDIIIKTGVYTYMCGVYVEQRFFFYSVHVIFCTNDLCTYMYNIMYTEIQNTDSYFQSAQ